MFQKIQTEKRVQLTDFLPTTFEGSRQRGWDYLDVILFSGDAYVDHPSFGAAVIGRILEAEGYRVAIVPQPTGMVTSATLRSSDGHASFLELHRAVWTLWSISTQPTAVCVRKMLTVRMVVTICAPNIQR